MKKNIDDLLQFKLNSEVADLEFQIIPIPPFKIMENNLSLEIYEYFGEINEFLGCKIKQVFLYYNADILMRVELIFQENVIHTIKRELERVDIDFQDSIMFLKLYQKAQTKETVLLYGLKVLQNS